MEGQRTGLGTVAVAALAGAVLLFLIAPVVIILIVSFSGADYLRFPPPSLSLRWYQRFLGIAAWRQAIGVSTQVAFLTMVFATGLGFLASLALVRGRFRGKGAIYAFLLSPTIVPTIITAIGLYFFFVRFKATGSILAMALGHTVLALPVVVIIIAATLQGFDVRFEQAALSLGASRLTALRRVTLPLILPGVLSAALFAFLTSFDELLIPLFLSGVEVQTLTVRVWNSLLLEVDPTIAAVSSFLIGVTTAVLGASAAAPRARRGAGDLRFPPMALHFSTRELADRRRRACRAMIARGLDGLLLFRQESMYYLTGYDTSGYSMFQGMYLGADGSLALCTRSADLRQARITSVVEDVRIWRDRQGATPGEDLRDMLESHGCRGKRLGVEYHAYGLTTQRGQMVDAALHGFCRTEDASDLVRLLRLVKSPAELRYVRRAGELADSALAVANRLTVPGAAPGAIYGEMMKTILSGDGDPSASRWPMGSGREALLVRYHTGHGPIAQRDQVTFEFAAAYRHYHACLMNVVVTGRVDPRHRDMFRACREALTACEATLRPGRTVGDVFATHARVLARSGVQGPHAQRLRLHAWRDLPADLDGRADDLRRPSAGAGSGHGLLHPHDPAQQPHGALHVAGRDVDHHGAGGRAGDPCPARAGRQLRSGT